MARRAAKEQELNLAVSNMDRSIVLVKNLTEGVAKGDVSKKELDKALGSLENQSNKVKILTQESKILGDWVLGDVTIAPPSNSSRIFIGISILLLLIKFFWTQQ